MLDIQMKRIQGGKFNSVQLIQLADVNRKEKDSLSSEIGRLQKLLKREEKLTIVINDQRLKLKG